ncbi:MAG TPA: class I SAM-dependent methyltransferase [Clostridia bacterium]|nr:class I SAM-dependent methyltransferase [Clostridia bacterium]
MDRTQHRQGERLMPPASDRGAGADLPNDPAPTERRERQPDRPLDHASWDRRYSQAELVWSATPNQCFAEEVAPLAPGRALDLGSGKGRNAVWLAERGWDTTAVDFSGVGIEKARSLAARRGCSVTWIVEDLLTFRPAAHAFDLVALVYIHLPALQRRQVLTTAVRALAPAGRLVVVGHDRSNLLAGVGGPQDPSILFTPEEIVSDLDGLDIVRSQKVVRHVTTPDGERDAIDALVVAVAPGAA